MIFVRIAFRNLVQSRRRTLLLSLALALVTLFLVASLALSGGVRNTLLESATILASGHVNVAGFFKAKVSDAFPMVIHKDEIRRLAEENTPGLAFVVDRGRGWGKIISETGSMTGAMWGVDVREEGRLVEALRLAPHSAYIEGGDEELAGDVMDLAEDDTILVFASQAERLGLNVGDRVTVTSQTLNGQQNTLDLRVVAVAKDIGLMSAWTVFVPKQVTRDLYGLNDDVTGAVMVYLNDPGTAAAAMDTLRGVLEREGYRLMEHRPEPFWAKFETVAGEDWTGQSIDLTTWDDEVAMLKWLVTAIDSVSFLLLLTLLAIIVVGVTNSMIMAVRERTQEVGTLRAIGMERGQVLRMVLTEALMLGVMACTAGAVAGAVLVWSLDAAAIQIPSPAVRMLLLSDVLHLAVDPAAVVASVLGIALITVLASVWPALRAARMRPVTAIHHVR